MILDATMQGEEGTHPKAICLLQPLFVAILTLSSYLPYLAKFLPFLRVQQISISIYFLIG